ncbi:MAG: guanylate kinase [Thermoleophilaceae bacterium]
MTDPTPPRAGPGNQQPEEGRAPLVLVITGPSGVGKGTLIRALRERLPGLELSVSATTRAPRPGEVDDRDYHFLSREEFDRRLEAGDFLEHATYAGNRYGTPRSELSRPRPAAPAAGEDEPVGLVLEIELQGARQVREALPEAEQVFIAPPSLAALRARLVARGADSAPVVEERLRAARDELEARSEFRHVVVNDRLEDAIEDLAAVVSSICGTQRRGAPQ